MIELEVTNRQNYDGKTYRAGETLCVKDEAEAADLIALRMAVRKPVAINRAIDTESTQVETSTENRSVSGRDQYKRRDMRAAK